MNKKPKKLNKDEQRRLKELDGLQQSLQSNLELACARVREEQDKYRTSQMTEITHKVIPIKDAYTEARKQAEQEKNRAIKAAHRAYTETEEQARATQREALASVEEEINNLDKEVARRIATDEAELNKEFNAKLRALVQERQAIRGGDEPKVPEVPDSPAVSTPEPEKADGEAVGVS